MSCGSTVVDLKSDSEDEEDVVVLHMTLLSYAYLAIDLGESPVSSPAMTGRVLAPLRCVVFHEATALCAGDCGISLWNALLRSRLQASVNV